VGLPEARFSGVQLHAAFQDWLRVADVVTSQWTHLAAVAVGVLGGIALAAGRRDASTESAPERRPDRPRWLIATALILPVPVLLIGSYLVILAVRQGYGPTGWTYSRIWFNFIAPMVFALTAYGILAGRAMGMAIARRSPTARTAGSLAGAFAAGVFAVYAMATLVPTVDSLAHDTRMRAIVWDRQDERIRSEVADGATEITYQPLYIGGLAEPFFTKTYSRDWAANCAADYYGVQRLVRPGGEG
jgi:hypothetical protein